VADENRHSAADRGRKEGETAKEEGQKEEGKEMKKRTMILILAVLCIICLGCAQMQKCEMIGKPTAYASERHLIYSWFGYKNTTYVDYFNARTEGWWGCPVYFSFEPKAGPADGSK
jgi:hypothetical protein